MIQSRVKRTIVNSNIKYDETMIKIWNKRNITLQPSIKQAPINKRLFIEVIFTLRQNISTVTVTEVVLSVLNRWE